MKRILLVEDTLEVQKLVTSLLRSQFEVAVADSLGAARRAMQKGPYDLILLDLSLPDGSSFSFFAEINGGGQKTPVFFLTASSQDHDKLQAFQMGAQDYITKPFSPLELKARVEARLRREEGAADLIRKGNLQLSLETQRVTIKMSTGDQKPIDLTPHEFKLLAHLMRHEEHVLSRQQIMEAVWGAHVHVLDRTVDAHISRLRRKLGGSDFNVQTIVGAGYSFRRAERLAA